jgi:hypothetical protein
VELMLMDGPKSHFPLEVGDPPMLCIAMDFEAGWLAGAAFLVCANDSVEPIPNTNKMSTNFFITMFFG